MKYQVAVLGDRDSVMGYKTIGMSVFELDSDSDVVATIDDLSRQQFAIIFITEAVAEQHENELKKYRERQMPAIIPIPSMEGATGYGMRQIQESVRRAVGIDLYGQDAVKDDENVEES